MITVLVYSSMFIKWDNLFSFLILDGVSIISLRNLWALNLTHWESMWVNYQTYDSQK